MTPNLIVRTALLVAAVLGTVACSAAQPSPRQLLAEIDPATVSASFLARQRVTLTTPDTEPQSFDAIVEKVDGDLTVVGLTPFGTRAFSALLADGTVKMDVAALGAPRDLDVDAVMLDVARVYVLGYPQRPRADGAHERVGPARIPMAEVWRSGGLRELRFARTPGGSVGSADAWVRMAFDDPGWRPGEQPPNVRIDYPALGVRLDVATTSWTPLR